MKKILTIILISLTSLSLSFSQNEVDALRYSQSFAGGTARSLSMGGAFGALGGDLSAASINPAGMAVYRTSELTLTPSVFYNETNSSFYEQSYLDSKYNFNFQNIGYIGAFVSNSKNGWVSTNFAIGYNRLNNFNANILIESTNDYSSIVDAFTVMANEQGVTMDDNGNAFGYANLVYDLDPADGETNYTNDFQLTPSYGQLQNKSIRSNGSMGEIFFSYGASYSHKLYLGTTIGIQNVFYEENTDLSEQDIDDAVPNFINLNYHEHLETSGLGFNLKLGAIYRPVDFIRFGAAVHTPTFFSLEDHYYSDIESIIEYIEGPGTAESEITDGHFDYQVNTPLKGVGSIALVIEKVALVSFDYEMIDYSTVRLRSADYSFVTENKAIQDRYRATSNMKTGAEFRFGPISLRAGYAYYGSPYKSSEANKNASFSSYSGGLGIRDNSFFFDLAFVHTTSTQYHFLYGLESSKAKLNSNSNQIIATLGFKL